ncbi:MAG: hypothetical protein NT062_01030, partial [Proteobacteria bacterium]|nr:hypothetical protein [Pseudomonadota bacterium]
YREQTIAVGETIAVLGAAVREPDPDVQPTSVGYREAQPMRLRLASSARMRLRISDSKSTTA